MKQEVGPSDGHGCYQPSAPTTLTHTHKVKVQFLCLPEPLSAHYSAGIRVQQAGGTSSTRRISGNVDKSLLPSAHLPSPPPQHLQSHPHRQLPQRILFQAAVTPPEPLCGPLLGVFSHALLSSPLTSPLGVLEERGESEFTSERNGK